MLNNLEPFFEKYENIVKQIDNLVNKIKKDFSDLVVCQSKCSDCCYALFDLSLIEAIYLNNRFNTIENKKKKLHILDISNKIDRKIHKIKRTSQNNIKDGIKSPEQILYEISTSKIKCPLLSSDNLCEIYEFRPITCRAYGVPTSFGNKGHTCGLSGFETGNHYPTINLDNVHKRLYSLSYNLAKELKSRYIKIADVLMPISMALLTNFNNEYLGLKDEEKET